MFIEGWFRTVVVGSVAVFLARAWVPLDAPSAYVAVGLTLVYSGLIIVGRPAVFRDGFAGALVDSVLISMLVAGTGGIGSAFTPLYLLAALRLSHATGNRKVVVGAPCCS